MIDTALFYDGLGRLTQVGGATGVQLVRIGQVSQGNQYQARAIEFDEDGQSKYADENTLDVTNLAEPADVPGVVEQGTDAVAIDVEGRWVVFIRQAELVTFPAKVIGSQGNAVYTLREQTVDTEGSFADKAGTSNITAKNLAELSLGPGAAVDDDTIVLVATLRDQSNPPNLHYVFDHPAYAKYLD